MTTNFRIAVVGGPEVGKTSSWVMWINNVVIEKYECTISEGPRNLVNIGKKQYFCDVADVGKSEFEAMTNIIYTKSHGFLVLYSTTDPESFTAAEEKLQEINKVRKKAVEEGKEVTKACFVLWGTKSDLVDERKVTVQQAEELAKQFGIPFIEGSTRDKNETNEAYMTLVRQMVDVMDPPQSSKRRRCIVM